MLSAGEVSCSSCPSGVHTGQDSPVHWYKAFFDYVGEFADGFAPAADRADDPQVVCYVAERIPDELHQMALSGKLRVWDIPRQFSINETIWRSLESLGRARQLTWAGEFRDGQALISQGSTIYTVDKQGNIGEAGRFDSPIRYGGAAVARTKSLCPLAKDNSGSCIINYRGVLVRNKAERLVPFRGSGFAVSFPSEDSFVDIRTGQQVFKGPYESFEGWTDDQGRWVIVATQLQYNGQSQCSCFFPGKQMSSAVQCLWAKPLLERNGKLLDQRLLLCTGEYEHYFVGKVLNMIVMDVNGAVLLEYESSPQEQFCVVGGNVYFLAYDKDCSTIHVIDTTRQAVPAFAPGATKVIYLGEGFFRAQDEDGRHALIDKEGRYTIPFGRFEMIGDVMSDGGVRGRDKGCWGFSDGHGKILIPLIYESIDSEYKKDRYPTIEVTIRGLRIHINSSNRTWGDCHPELKRITSACAVAPEPCRPSPQDDAANLLTQNEAIRAT